MRRGLLGLSILILISTFAYSGCSQPRPKRTLASKTVALKDVPYKFDQEKVSAANDTFALYRSFVDYYYLLASANRTSFAAIPQFWNSSVFCVGDAHPENFGVLIQETGNRLFSDNDYDDSGPCPAVLDIVRFMSAAKLYDNNVDVEEILKAYVSGLKTKSFDIPKAVKNLVKESYKRGFGPNPKDVAANKFIRDGNTRNVSAPEYSLIRSAIADLLLESRILDVVATSKVGGGSGGLLRYQILLLSGRSVLHLEMKELTKPSIYPVSANIPNPQTRVMQAIGYIQGNTASSYYRVVKIGPKFMLMRPRFYGNVPMALKDHGSSDNRDIIYFESYVLGRIHASSLQNREKFAERIAASDVRLWESDVAGITSHYKRKLGELKGK